MKGAKKMQTQTVQVFKRGGGLAYSFQQQEKRRVTLRDADEYLKRLIKEFNTKNSTIERS
jgi:hypothetical protein